MSGRNRWSAAELVAFLTFTRGTRLEAAWHIAFGGLRTGELLALRWADVDLGGRHINVRNAVVGVPYIAIAPSSISDRSRVVGVGSGLQAVLQAHRERQQAERSEWGDRYGDQDLVVCQESGQPLHPRELTRVFGALVDEAGLPPTGLAATRFVDRAPSLPRGAEA